MIDGVTGAAVRLPAHAMWAMMVCYSYGDGTRARRKALAHDTSAENELAKQVTWANPKARGGRVCCPEGQESEYMILLQRARGLRSMIPSITIHHPSFAYNVASPPVSWCPKSPGLSWWLVTEVEKVFEHKAKSQGKNGSAFNIFPSTNSEENRTQTKSCIFLQKHFLMHVSYIFQFSLKVCPYWEIFLWQIKWIGDARLEQGVWKCLPRTGEISNYQKVSKRRIRMGTCPSHTPTNKTCVIWAKRRIHLWI